MAMRKNTPDDFWARVDKENGPLLAHVQHLDQCWMWIAWRDRDGYGRFTYDAKGKRTHRLAWILTFGEIPPDRPFVCHHCDNPSCVRPSHLFTGTTAGNNHDRDIKGRQAKGDRHWARTRPDRLARGARSGRHTKPERTARGDANGSRTHPERQVRGELVHTARLTEANVREIRRRWAKREATQREMAAALGVSLSIVHNACNRVTWKHVE